MGYKLIGYRRAEHPPLSDLWSLSSVDGAVPKFA
jgi:hypothetical protein